MRFILTMAVLVLTASCSVTKYAADVPAAEVYPIALIEPLSYIEVMQKDHQMYVDDTLSAESSRLLAGILQEHLPIDCVIPVEYDGEMAAEVNVLPGIESRILFSATIPVKTRQLILDSGHRYGAIIFANGFTRERGSYASDMAKGVILGIATAILTMGAVTSYGIPTKSISQLSLMIVDAEADRVIYYNRTKPQELEPLNEKNLRSQIRGILKGFK